MKGRCGRGKVVVDEPWMHLRDGHARTAQPNKVCWQGVKSGGARAVQQLVKGSVRRERRDVMVGEVGGNVGVRGDPPKLHSASETRSMAETETDERREAERQSGMARTSDGAVEENRDVDVLCVEPCWAFK